MEREPQRLTLRDDNVGPARSRRITTRHATLAENRGRLEGDDEASAPKEAFVWWLAENLSSPAVSVPLNFVLIEKVEPVNDLEQDCSANAACEGWRDER